MFYTVKTNPNTIGCDRGFAENPLNYRIIYKFPKYALQDRT